MHLKVLEVRKKAEKEVQKGEIDRMLHKLAIPEL